MALIQALDLRRHDVSALSDKALRQEAEKCVAELIKTYPEIDSDSGKQELINLVSAEAVGLGVLEPLLEDASITEISRVISCFTVVFTAGNASHEFLLFVIIVVIRNKALAMLIKKRRLRVLLYHKQSEDRRLCLL